MPSTPRGDAAGSGRNGGVREAAIVTGPLGSGTFQFLGQAPGGTASVARGISSNGLVVGEGNSSTTANAVIYWPSPGSPIELDRLGQPWARAGGVNAAGQIVGGIGGGSMGTTGILWDGLTPYVLANLIQNNTGWKLDYAAAINDAGQILAIGSLNGIPAVVRLDPVGVPEPSTALLALGAGAVLFWRRWRC